MKTKKTDRTFPLPGRTRAKPAREETAPKTVHAKPARKAAKIRSMPESVKVTPVPQSLESRLIVNDEASAAMSAEMDFSPISEFTALLDAVSPDEADFNLEQVPAALLAPQARMRNQAVRPMHMAAKPAAKAQTKAAPTAKAEKKGPQVFIHASRIYTGSEILKKDGRKLVEADLAPILDGAIVFDEKRILWVGPTADLPEKYKKLKSTDLKGKQAVMPGLIDSHTHLVFGGSRAHEFARRCAGATYQEIANEGGGILTTVSGTRDATVEQLFESGLKRALIAYRHGVRTIECKSGYGLDHDSEIKCLTVVQHLKEALPQMTFVSTYMGAHAIPKDKKKTQYIDEMLHETMPFIIKNKLADFCDVFIDEGYYSVTEGERILRDARKMGFKLKVHADELANTESTKLAVKLKAHSADHLLKISERGIKELADSDTVATLLPGTAFYLKEAHAPARKLLDAGARVAIATDFNPGSCYSLNLPLMLNLSALYLQMNAAEIFAAVTLNAAKALDLDSRKGALIEGYDSDFVVLPYDRFEEMYYRLGW